MRPVFGCAPAETADVWNSRSPRGAQPHSACMLPLVLTLYALGIRVPTRSCPPSEEAEVYLGFTRVSYILAEKFKSCFVTGIHFSTSFYSPPF